MDKTRLDEIVDNMPGEQRRFVWKQGEIAAHIWRIMSNKKPAWTQRDLARKAKMKESYLSYLLSGTANPTLKTICALEEALGEDIVIAPSPRRAKELAATLAIAVAPNAQVRDNIIQWKLVSSVTPQKADNEPFTLDRASRFIQFGTTGMTA